MEFRTPASKCEELTLWFESALLAEGWRRQVRIGIAEGCIVRVEEGAPPAAQDERHAIALPGLANLHSHAFQRAMAGLTQRRGPGEDSFWTWRARMYQFLERLSPPDLEAIAAQAYMEMLEAGFTRVGEFHYLHHATDGARYSNVAEHIERIAAAAAGTGIALTILPTFYAHAGFGGAAPEISQRRFVCSLHEFARLLDAAREVVKPLEDAVVGLAAHSLRAVTPTELAAVTAMAASGPIHIHIAEQVSEVDDCIAWSGQRPVEWLLDHAALDRRWCLVHATHMTAEEVRRLAQSGAVAGLCPITEADLGDGLFPAMPYRIAGGSFGIGSDSNTLIDAAQELRLLEYGQRLVNRSRNVLVQGPNSSTGRFLFEGALSGGSQALTTRIAALEPGAPADIVTLNDAHASFAARSEDALLDSWIFAGRDGMIDCVWRAGRKVVSGGRHRRRATIEASYRRVLPGLLA